MAAADPIRLSRVVCGVDDSPQSDEAARQALAISEEDAALWAVAVWNPAVSMLAGIHSAEVRSDLREQSTAALERVRSELPRLQPALWQGSDVAGLLSAAEEMRADLLAVGSHGRSQVAGVALGSVATAMALHAPCSTLIARDQGREDAFPSSILVGTDGSSDSLAAAGLAGEIAARTGAEVVAAGFGDDESETSEAAAEAARRVESAGGARCSTRVGPGSAHKGLGSLAEELDASLLVVGSRGLGGLRHLGSVSERLAHTAPCSVLIARRPVLPEPARVPRA